jgi:hypothetical protein
MKISKEQELKKFDGRTDEINPMFMFSLTNTQLIAEALTGDFDVKYMLRGELANRGLDEKGLWIGFNQAKKLHKIK